MFHPLLKPLVLFIAFAGFTGALAAPAHQHQIKPHAQDLAHRDDQLLSHSGVAEPITIVRTRRGREENSAIGKRVTNAMRFADGLPPLTPRKLYNGSRAGSAHIARSSPMPVSGSGILVYDQDGYSGGGSQLGYVSKEFNDQGAYYFTTDCMTGIRSEDLFLGALTNRAELNGYSNIGFTVNDATNPILSTGSSNFAYMSGTVTTPTGSIPVLNTGQSLVPDQNLYFESNVWSLGADKGNRRFVLDEIIPTWINPDGDVVQLEIGYVPGWANSIIASGNLSQLGANSDGEFEVTRIRLYLAGAGCQK